MHEILIVDSAVKDIKILPKSNQGPILEWMKKELSAERAKNGTALKGALQGFYVISRPQRVQVIYWIDQPSGNVVIVCVLPGTVSIELKKAELIREYGDKLPKLNKTPLQIAFEAVSKKLR